MSNLAPSSHTRNDDIEPSKNLARKKTFEVIERPKPEKIRAELNIEKWPGIWQPSKSKNKPQLRVFERQVTLEDDSKVIARLEVSFNHLGTLTTEEGKMFRALIKQWEDAGRPSTQVFFSDRQLARILRKAWGTNVIESTTKSLRKLRTISLEWVNSYYDKSGRMFRQRQPMTFLAELKIIERAEDGAVNSAKGYFRFDDSLLANLLANHTKPFLIDEYFDIKTDIGLLLYGHLDLILANKNRYERCTKDLFEDLGLQNAEYRLMNKRKRALEMSVKELVGRRISTGVIASVMIEKTHDKKDYKIVVEKSSARAHLTQTSVAAAPQTARVTLPPAHKSREVEEQAEELVCYFHKKFHGIEHHQPRAKELNQAVSLIATLGLEQARYVIDFSHNAAERTKYQPQTFGGILQYESKAVSQFEEARVARERSRCMETQRTEMARFEQAHDAYIRTAVDIYLADSANEADVAALETEQVAAARRKYPLMTRAQQEGLARQMVKSELRNRLGLLSFEDFIAREKSALPTSINPEPLHTPETNEIVKDDSPYN